MYIKNHLIFSLSFSIFFIKLCNFFNFKIDIFHIIPISLFSSLLPDLDHPRSYLGCKFKLISFFLSNYFGHRKITHSLFGMLFFFVFIFFMNIFYFNFDFDVIIGIYLGYFSHILADMFTYNGIDFLWPYKFKFRIPFIYIFLNKKIESYFCIFLLFLSFFIDKIFYYKCIFYKIFIICLSYINLII